MFLSLVLSRRAFRMGLMVWGSRGGSGSLFAHQIIFSATSLMSLDGFCRHCGEDCRLLDTSSVFLKETLISALTHSLHQGDWPPCSLQPSSLPWEGNGVIPTLLGAILHSAHYSWPTQGFHFLKLTTRLPASGLCTGWSHCLGHACPGSSLGWFLFIL